MEKINKEKLNKILWILSPLHKEQVEWLKKRRLSTKERFSLLPKQFKMAIAGGLSLILALGAVYTFSNADKAFAIEINGKKVAIVENEKNAKVVLAEVIKDKSKQIGQNVQISDLITYKKTKAKNINLDATFVLKNKLHNALTFTTTGTSITVNGEEKVVLLNKKQALETLDDLAKANVSAYKTVKIDKVEYIDKIELVDKKINLKNVIAEKDAAALLNQGKQKVETYKVASGDSVWVIARKNDMLVSQIQEANPGLNVEKLKLGQDINLNKFEPIVKLKIFAKATVNEDIAFDVKIEKDDSLYNGQEKVKQQGVLGSREVVYDLVMVNNVAESKNVVEQKIIKQPTSKVVSKGSKYIVASRGDGGSGQLGWPVSGPIWSGYGPRGREFHPGIDIGASTGTPIGAAADGVITFAGWYSGYGNFIIVDHGNGLVTRYGHLSRYNTSVGARVSRGQIIGFVGSTGRATGPHLHFEVQVNGRTQNPVGYLR